MGRRATARCHRDRLSPHAGNLFGAKGTRRGGVFQYTDARNDRCGLVGGDRTDAQCPVPAGHKGGCLFRSRNRTLGSSMKLLSALVSLALLAQSGIPVDGTVRDSHGQPVSNAAVRLKTERQTFTANTGTDGRYRFQAVPAGSYTLHAEFSGRGEVTFGPFTLSERKTVDLTLSPAKPEFFDEPTFIVAGVSDGSARGGHGSDAILRSSEALTKAAASLGKESTVDRAPLEAVREYQRAAELDPSERNLFDWGAELLAHRAHDPAIEVFTRGNRLFPKSTRMLLGLAVAYYAKGSYDQAAQRFFDATD